MKKFTKEELRLLSEIDMANYILEDAKGGLNTLELYQKVCDNMEKNMDENKIADFFSSLTTDKRFILLENGNFDLRKNHAIKVVIEEEEEIDEEQLDQQVEEVEEDNIEQTDEDVDLDDGDDLGELVIVDEDELEE